MIREKYLINNEGLQTHSSEELESQIIKLIKQAYDNLNEPNPIRLDSKMLHDFISKLEVLSNSKIECFVKVE